MKFRRVNQQVVGEPALGTHPREKDMSPIEILVALIAIEFFIPMDPKIDKIFQILIVVVVALWIVSLIFPGLDRLRMPQFGGR